MKCRHASLKTKCLKGRIGSSPISATKIMKKVSCSYEHCGKRRRHWEDPFSERGQQSFEVPDSQDGPWYCSIECAVYAGAIKKNLAP